MGCIRPVFCVVLLLLVVLDEVVRFPATADDSGWWQSELCPLSLPADQSSEASRGRPRLSRGANRISPGGGMLSSVLFLQWQQGSQSISSLGGFKVHHMRTSRQFVIRIISASGSGASILSCRRHVPCLVAPIRIPNPTPGAMVLSKPASRFGKVGSVSSI